MVNCPHDTHVIAQCRRAGFKGGGGKRGNCPPSMGPMGTPQGPLRAPLLGLEGPAVRAPRCGYFNVFARKTAIFTKNDTFGHANEGGPAPREGGPALGEGGPAGAPRPLPPPVQPSTGPATSSINCLSYQLIRRAQHNIQLYCTCI